MFYDENGFPRSHTCTFDLTINGRDTQVPIDLSSIVAGSTKPYDVAPAHDWAVARLIHAVTGVKPYGIAADIHENEPVTFRRPRPYRLGAGPRISPCRTALFHDQLSAGEEGTREFSFDCDTGDGASGGAVMFDRDYSRIGAVLVGWRSNKPFKGVAFSHTHYNFAVTMEGAFRQAVYAAAGKMMVSEVERSRVAPP